MRLMLIFEILAVLALLIFLFIAVQAGKSQSCICSFVGECEYNTEINRWVRYRACSGSCFAYSGWEVDVRCPLTPIKTPLPSFP